VKLTQIRNSGPIKPNRWKHTKDEQLSTEQLSNGYTKASGMKENNDSSNLLIIDGKDILYITNLSFKNILYVYVSLKPLIILMLA